MRLTTKQINDIRNATAEFFGEQARVWLFGSRTDDRKRGGDIDLLICPESTAATPILAKKIAFLGSLERLLGERKIDVVIEACNDVRPIVKIAHQQGIKL